jgi:OFA family oxalate/formate antiporter-like MFS transporter
LIKKQSIFYGWWILVGLFMIGIVASLGRYNLTAFLPFIMSELGWARETIGLAQSIAIWLYALFVLLAGVLVDRIGSRRVFLIGGAVTVLGWVLFSTAQSPWQLYLYYGVLLSLAVGMTHYSRSWRPHGSGSESGLEWRPASSAAPGLLATPYFYR